MAGVMQWNFGPGPPAIQIHTRASASPSPESRMDSRWGRTDTDCALVESADPFGMGNPGATCAQQPRTTRTGNLRKCRDICLSGRKPEAHEKTPISRGLEWLFYRENKPKTAMPRLGLEPRTL